MLHARAVSVRRGAPLQDRHALHVLLHALEEIVHVSFIRQAEAPALAPHVPQIGLCARHRARAAATAANTASLCMRRVFQMSAIPPFFALASPLSPPSPAAAAGLRLHLRASSFLAVLRRASPCFAVLLPRSLHLDYI